MAKTTLVFFTLIHVEGLLRCGTKDEAFFTTNGCALQGTLQPELIQSLWWTLGTGGALLDS